MFFPVDAEVQRRNYFVAFLTGTMTGIAWWILIDILARSNEQFFPRLYILPGLAISVMLLAIHFIPDSAFHDNIGFGSVKCARISLFLVFLIIFTAVVASIWIFIADYATNNRSDRKDRYIQWFGAGNMLFTILLALAALVSRFGRKPADSLMI